MASVGGLIAEHCFNSEILSFVTVSRSRYAKVFTSMEVGVFLIGLFSCSLLFDGGIKKYNFSLSQKHKLDHKRKGKLDHKHFITCHKKLIQSKQDYRSNLDPKTTVLHQKKHSTSQRYETKAAQKNSNPKYIYSEVSEIG